MKNLIDYINESYEAWRWKNKLQLDRLEKAILDDGYKFVRDGSMTDPNKDVSQMKFWSWRFYRNDKEKQNLRIYYDIDTKRVKEIAQSSYDDPEKWHYIKPDLRKLKWRKLYSQYDK